MADIDTTGDKNFTRKAMKKNFCLFLGALLATSVLAQTTNLPPAPTSPPPPKKAGAKPATKRKTAPAAKPAAKKPSLADELRSIPLVPGPATVIASNVNVRGRSGLLGEVLTRITKGSTVTVIEEITLKHSKENEPSAWAKIASPAGARVYVNASFIDPATKTVKPKKLNLRGGAGENYSVIGTLEKGAAVKEISVKGDWMEIEPPAGAFAFVAAQYLKQEAPAIVAAAPKPAEPAPTPTPVSEPAPVAAPTTEPPATTLTPAPPVTTPAPAPTPATAADEPPPTRIVQHEGLVKGTWSIQAPTRFALVAPDTGKTINYLYTTSTNLDLSRYKGLHIVVTGEEGLDERWKNTPVITIQRIQVVE
jgi:uncharacterized protein YgiM (DUF1202 family)